MNQAQLCHHGVLFAGQGCVQRGQRRLARENITSEKSVFANLLRPPCPAKQKRHRPPKLTRYVDRNPLRANLIERAEALALLRESQSSLRRTKLGCRHGPAIGTRIDDSAAWKAQKNHIGFPRLFMFPRLGVYHVRVTQNDGTTKTNGVRTETQASVPELFGESIHRPGVFIAAPWTPG
jgi:hypothetical protein